MTDAETTDLSVLLVSTYELGRQPFGLASPAAWLRRSGVSVTCADLSVSDFPADTAAEADVVAFYLPMHTATRLALPLIERVRALNPTAHLCCYGLYGATNAELLHSLGITTVLAGEFETGLLDLCDRLRDQASPSFPSSPVSTTSIVHQQFLVPDRDDLPALEQYAHLSIGKETAVVGYVEASRGCRHLCRHCPVVPVYGGRFFVVQRDVVLEDIRRQVAAGAAHITFGDPDFFNGIGHAIPIVEALHREFPALTYDVTIKIEHLLKHSDRLAILRETGCAFVTSAVESVDDRVLDLLDKGHTRADFVEVVQRFRDEKLVLNPTFVTFTPWTDLESYGDLLRLLLELGLVDCVAPIQLAIRLLIPAGSRLLELEEVRHLVGPFDRERLGYPWEHADPAVDELFERTIELVCNAESHQQSRRQIFAALWKLVHEALGEAVPDLRIAPPPVTIPQLTEPWYC